MSRRVSSVQRISPINQTTRAHSTTDEHQNQSKTPPKKSKRRDEAITEDTSSLSTSSQVLHRALDMIIDEASGEFIVRVVDIRTKRVIEQVPVSELTKQYPDLSGLLLDKNV